MAKGRPEAVWPYSGAVKGRQERGSHNRVSAIMIEHTKKYVQNTKKKKLVLRSVKKDEPQEGSAVWTFRWGEAGGHMCY